MELRDLLTILIAFGAGVLVPLIQSWWQRKSREKLETELDLDVGDVAQKIVSGSGAAVDIMEKLLNRYEAKFEMQEQEIASLQARLTAMQIDEQKKSVQENERNQAIAEKIGALEDWSKTLVDTLRKNNIEVPPRPDKLKDRDTLEKIRAVQFPIKPGGTS